MAGWSHRLLLSPTTSSSPAQEPSRQVPPGQWRSYKGVGMAEQSMLERCSPAGCSIPPLRSCFAYLPLPKWVPPGLTALRPPPKSYATKPGFGAAGSDHRLNNTYSCWCIAYRTIEGFSAPVLPSSPPTSLFLKVGASSCNGAESPPLPMDEKMKKQQPLQSSPLKQTRHLLSSSEGNLGEQPPI